MKTTIPSQQKKLQRLFLSRSLLIFCSILLISGLQNSFAQWDFEQSEEEHSLVVIEAENFTSNIPKGDDMWTLFEDADSCSGGAAMLAVTASPFTDMETVPTTSPVLTYKIKFIRTGTHYLWARASRLDGGSDSYHAAINANLTESGFFLTFHNTDFDYEQWGWINFQHTVGPATLDVAAGVNDLNIYIRENNFKIDKIILTTSDTNSFIPDSLGPAETLPPNSIRSVSSNFNENLFKLSTNMVTEELLVKINENYYLQGKLEILDLQGKVLRNVAINNDSQYIVNVADLQSGMYLVRVQLADNSVLVKKFVKN